MSEYQYYEFQAIDRPLTRDLQAELRSCSSRARISSTRFVNEYHWGDLKGNPMEWMKRYFDAHLYLSNFGSRVISFRFPLAWIDPEMIRPYEVEGALELRTTPTHLILSFLLDSDPGEYDDDQEAEPGCLSALLPIRAALAACDTRALYLGWLSGVRNGLVGGSTKEPPVPPGLDSSEEALDGLAEFLHVDEDLRKAAARRSATEPSKPSARDAAAWLAEVLPAEKDRWLASILLDNDLSVAGEMRRQFHSSIQPSTTGTHPDRSVDELLAEAEDVRSQRLDRENLEAAAARKRHVESLIGGEAGLWQSAIKLSESSSTNYQDSAISMLTDLRDLAGLQGQTKAFNEKLVGLIELRRRKSRFMERLKQAGLA